MARQAGTVMAALELLPAQPSDLTAVVADPKEFASLIAPAFYDVNSSDLVRYLRNNLDAGRIDWWHKTIHRLMEEGVATPLLAGTPPYPRRLGRCWDAPPLLFSTAPVMDAPSVAIIGSRATTPDVLNQARRLAAEIAAGGTVVVSGLAMGVDTAAHMGALDAGGQTIAVMGTGITQVYPEQNRDLARSIREQGVLMSQFAPYAPRTRTTFLRRNHVIAGLSDVSVVMAGRAQSGSRHEVEQALTYRRVVLIWEPVLGHQAWAQKLVGSGQARFISSAEEVRIAVAGAER